MEKKVRTKDENIRDRNFVHVAFFKNDISKYDTLILCHGRAHGIYKQLENFWDRAITIDAPISVFYAAMGITDPDRFIADIYWDVTKPLDTATFIKPQLNNKLALMKEHFQNVIFFGCSGESLALVKTHSNMQDAVNFQFLINIYTITKPGGIVYMPVLNKLLFERVPGFTLDVFLEPYKKFFDVKIERSNIMIHLTLTKKMQLGGKKRMNNVK